jgi:hypothetical protein
LGGEGGARGQVSPMHKKETKFLCIRFNVHVYMSATKREKIVN